MILLGLLLNQGIYNRYFLQIVLQYIVLNLFFSLPFLPNGFLVCFDLIVIFYYTQRKHLFFKRSPFLHDNTLFFWRYKRKEQEEKETPMNFILSLCSIEFFFLDSPFWCWHRQWQTKRNIIFPLRHCDKRIRNWRK